MADEEDIKLLQSGEKDLTKCDFRGADLSNIDLSDRNFTGALFQKAKANNTNFSGSIFLRARISQFTARSANFSGCKFNGAFTHNDLMQADLRFADFQRAHIASTNFSDANIIGANFSNAVLNENVEFKNVEYDESTLFNDATAVRAYSREACFSFYYFDKGRLVRKNDNAIIEPLSTDLQPSREVPKPTVKIIERYRPSVQLQIMSIIALIDKEIQEEGSKPNEFEKLQEWEKRIKFLYSTKDSLMLVAASLNSDNDNEAANKLQKLGVEFEEWFHSNSKEMVDWTARLTSTGIFIGAMSMLGAYMPIATPIVFSIVCGKRVIDTLKALGGKGD